MAHLRGLRLWLALVALAGALLGCAGGDGEDAAPLRVILHGNASQGELLDTARTWLIGKGVDVLYAQSDAKAIYNRTVLVARVADVESRQRLLELTGIQTWIWARQEEPAAPFEIYVGDDINQIMDTQ